MKVGKVIDCFGSNLGRIKTLGILFLIALFGFSMLRNGCDRQEMEELMERITGLNIRNDILREDVKEKDSLILASIRRVGELKDSLTLSEKRLTELKGDYGRLEAKYEDLSDSLLTIPTDSSYDFLIHEAYPYEGHKRYPFNEPQVRGIHMSYLENVYLGDMNKSLYDQLDEMAGQLQTKDMIVGEQDKRLMFMNETRQDLDTIIYNQDKVITVQDEQINKQRKSRIIWETTMGAIIIALAILAVGGN